MAQEIAVTVRQADNAEQFRREQRYADGLKGGAVSLDIHREHKGSKSYTAPVGKLLGFRVSWNARRPGGKWHRGWKSTMFATEEQARDFATGKWTYLEGWLRTVSR